MTFTEANRDQIRTYFGFPKLFVNANPFFESALTSLQPVSEGGSQVDNTIENEIIAVLGLLTNIETQITNIQSCGNKLAVSEVQAGANGQGTIRQDYGRALRLLKREGTDLIQRLCNRIGMQPVRPYFYSAGLQDWSSDNLPHWSRSRPNYR